MKSTWDAHKERYGLNFVDEEDEKRFEIYYQNELHIQKRNRQNAGFALVMNELGHLEPHEVSKCHIKAIDSSKVTKNLSFYDDELLVPDSVDWRTNGIVSGVKDQKRCGSCYSFSAVGAAESHYAKITGKMIELSEQEIVDCSGSDGNMGCNGGEMTFVFNYMEKHGLSTYDSYPYTGNEGTCARSSDNNSFHLKTFVEIPSGDEHMLRRAIAFVGPIAIAIDANHRDFMFYKSGILEISECSSTDLDHGVLAVGYSMTPKPHIIVKNSWGTAWGEEGYVKMSLFNDNNCGIATAASYPVPG